ncbi:MAG: Uma2 family endonuclease [Thermoanaerobaculia bacterium]
MAVPMRNRRITIEEFEGMSEAGILTEDDRVELIEGEIVEMTPIEAPHSGRTRWLIRELSRLFSERFILDVQNPIILRQQESVLCPDLMLLPPREEFFGDVTPGPADARLLIEVVDTTLSRDRRKQRLYAQAGVAEVWLVIIAEGKQSVLVCRRPEAGQYQDVREYKRGEVIEFEGESFEVDAVLGKPRP